MQATRAKAPRAGPLNQRAPSSKKKQQGADAHAGGEGDQAGAPGLDDQPLEEAAKAGEEGEKGENGQRRAGAAGDGVVDPEQIASERRSPTGGVGDQVEHDRDVAGHQQDEENGSSQRAAAPHHGDGHGMVLVGGGGEEKVQDHGHGKGRPER